MSLRFIGCCVIYCLMVGCSWTSSDKYLKKTEMSFPTNGSQLTLQKPLEPYRAYRIIITSPYNLKPAYSEARGNFIGDFEIEGTNLKAVYTDETSDGYISKLVFVYRGTDKPASLGFVKDHSKLIARANIVIRTEGFFEGSYREYIDPVWEKYDNTIILSLLTMPVIFYAWVYFSRRRQKNKALERKTEIRKQALVLRSHTKSLELMREIDKKANQKADKLMQRNFDELQAKVIFWRTKAYGESYFLNTELRKNFAVANRDKILSELEPEWSNEMLQIAQDLPLVKLLQEQEPGVLHWLHARHEVIGMAHKLTWLSDTAIDIDYEEVQDNLRIIVVDDAEIQPANPKSQRRKVS